MFVWDGLPAWIHRREMDMELYREGTAPVPPPTDDRNGQPWTEEEHLRLLGRVRQGADMADLAEAVHRKQVAVTRRLRLMLPLEHRGCPADQVLDAARRALASEDYDWRTALLLSPPPRPVVNPPRIVRSGIAGLEDEDLVTTAFALLRTPGLRCGRLLGEVGAEVVRRRGTFRQLVDIVEDHLCLMGVGGAENLDRAAVAWILAAEGWTAETRWADPWGNGHDETGWERASGW